MVLFGNETKSRSNVLLLGSDGLIGSAILKNWNSNYSLKILTRKQFDLRDTERLKRELIESSIDSVINAAGKVSGIKGNIESPGKLFLENSEVTLSVMRACLDTRIQRLIQFASACIYPADFYGLSKESMIGSGQVEETSRGYAYSKLMTVEGTRAIRKEHGLLWTTLIPSNIYGEGDWFHGEDGHVISMLVRKFLLAKESQEAAVEVWGDGTAIRNFLHVDDLAKSVIQVINSDFFEHSEMNVSGDSETTVENLARIIAKHTQYPGKIFFNSQKPGGAKIKLLDDSIIRSMGWKPIILLEDGLRKYCQVFPRNIT
jgi:GDP-L-fucose synthase